MKRHSITAALAIAIAAPAPAHAGLWSDFWSMISNAFAPTIDQGGSSIQPTAADRRKSTTQLHREHAAAIRSGDQYRAAQLSAELNRRDQQQMGNDDGHYTGSNGNVRHFGD